MNFESKIIDVSEFADIFIVFPLKVLFFFGVVALIVKLLFFRNAPMGIAGKMPSVLFDLCKVFIYGYVTAFVFFYNFETRTWSSQLPEKMYFSTFLLGCFSGYSCIDSLLSSIKAWLSPS